MYSMFLDDLRDAEKYYPNKGFITVRTYDEAVEYVKNHGVPVFISFDHDLGDEAEDEKTGYSFAKFIIDFMIDNELQCVFDYVVHSANPVGKANIECYLKNGLKFIRSQNV
jgi:hypothetical protein